MTTTYSPSYRRWFRKRGLCSCRWLALSSASTPGKWPIARSAEPDSSRSRGSRVVSGSTRRFTPGASFSRMSIRLGTSLAAVASAMASTKALCAVAGSKPPGASDSRSCCSASRTVGHSASAMGVGSTP
ncbi:hypothetical protein FQZ97_979790 [compost metagenome]